MKRLVWRFWLVGVLVLGGCDFNPPWWRHTDVPPGVQRISTEIVGALIPHRNQIYGCRWEYRHPDPGCRGFWIQDLETGGLLLVRDRERITGDFTPTVDGQYLVYMVVERDTSGVFHRTCIRVLVDDPWQVVDSIVRVPGGGAVPSPQDPDVFYVASSTQWGEVNVLWRLDFSRDTVIQETTVRWPKGMFIVPGKLGDSVVVMDGLGTLQPVEYRHHWVPVDIIDRKYLVILNYEMGRRYRLDVDVSALEDDAAFSGMDWVQGRDSMLVYLWYGGYIYPEEIHSWLIPNVSARLKEGGG